MNASCRYHYRQLLGNSCLNNLREIIVHLQSVFGNESNHFALLMYQMLYLHTADDRSWRAKKSAPLVPVFQHTYQDGEPGPDGGSGDTLAQ